MKIFEVDQSEAGADPNKLLGLVNFLVGRAKDTNATKQISQDAFIDLANSLGINLTKNNLAQFVDVEPLSNVLEPLDPNSGMITFRGAEIGPTNMSVTQAQNTVNQMAKSAMKKDRGA